MYALFSLTVLFEGKASGGICELEWGTFLASTMVPVTQQCGHDVFCVCLFWFGCYLLSNSLLQGHLYLLIQVSPPPIPSRG